MRSMHTHKHNASVEELYGETLSRHCEPEIRNTKIHKISLLGSYEYFYLKTFSSNTSRELSRGATNTNSLPSLLKSKPPFLNPGNRAWSICSFVPANDINRTLSGPANCNIFPEVEMRVVRDWFGLGAELTIRAVPRISGIITSPACFVSSSAVVGWMSTSHHPLFDWVLCLQLYKQCPYRPHQVFRVWCNVKSFVQS